MDYHPLIQLYMNNDHGIATLLDLHGQIIEQAYGYWIKIEAWQVDVSETSHTGLDTA